MIDALYVAATGMRGHQLQIDTIAHNLANLNTVGFRRGVVSFAEVSAALRLASAAEPTFGETTAATSMRGAGVISTVALSSTSGELKQTDEPLRLAIDGAGFLEVIRADGTPAYTRAGLLQINEDRMLATADGMPLAAQIEIPADASDVVIHQDGRVAVRTGETAEEQFIGQIELVSFPNPAALQAAGANLYVAPAAAGEPQIALPGESGMGALRQGFVETSNVQLTDELLTLMLAQRAFELNSRVVQAADQMLSITNSLPR